MRSNNCTNKIKHPWFPAFFVFACVMIVLTACWSDLDGVHDELGTSLPDPFKNATTPGDMLSVQVGTQIVNFIYTNNRDTITFTYSPVADTPVNNEEATLTRKFFMSETEVTNASMKEVLQWAYDHGRFSDVIGDHNGINESSVKYGERFIVNLDEAKISFNTVTKKFSIETGYESHPVTWVNWYGAVMFCNWLTEMRDGAGNTVNLVYTGIDGTWEDEETVVNNDRTGYRLPSINEWEYTARYIGTTEPTEGNLFSEYIAKDVRGGHANLTEGYYWTPANYASGALASCGNDTETRAVAWYSGMPGGDELKPVAHQSINPNQLGIYDMSGNAYEWCFTASGPDNRVYRGGAFSDTNLDVRVGAWTSKLPGDRDGTTGFRIARTQ